MTHGRYHPITQCKLIGGIRQGQQPDRAAHAHLRPVDPRDAFRRRAGQGRHGPGDVPGPQPGGPKAAFGYYDPEPADRPRDAQSAHPAGLLARRQHQPERDLPRDASWTSWRRPSAGPARVPAQADGKHPKHSRRAQCGGREGRLGQAAPAGRHPRARADDGLRQLRGGAAEVSVGAATRSRSTASWRATDPGYAVNPAQIDRQVAGSFVYGLSALFYGECTVKDGAIEQENFDTYNSMRIAEMPKVESIVMPSGTTPGAASASRRSGGGAGGAQRLLPATGKRIRVVPAEEPQPADRVAIARHDQRRPARPPLAFRTGLMTAAMHRRQFLTADRGRRHRRGAAASAAGAGRGRRVVVIGGGFGGASCARALRKVEPSIAVTLVEANAVYTRAADEQRRDRRPGRARAPAVRLRRAQAPRHRSRAVGRDRDRSAGALGDARRRQQARLRPAGAVARHRFPLGRDPGLRPRRRRRRCRTPGTTARRSRCCAASSRRWRTAAPS